MRPKFAHLPPFRPTTDTTNTAHYGIAKYLSNLRHPLTENEFTVKDSFEAAIKIQAIPSELLDERYRFTSFNVTLLFTTVSLNRTIKIILEHI